MIPKPPSVTSVENVDVTSLMGHFISVEMTQTIYALLDELGNTINDPRLTTAKILIEKLKTSEKILKDIKSVNKDNKEKNADYAIGDIETAEVIQTSFENDTCGTMSNLDICRNLGEIDILENSALFTDIHNTGFVQNESVIDPPSCIPIQINPETIFSYTNEERNLLLPWPNRSYDVYNFKSSQCDQKPTDNSCFKNHVDNK